MAFVPLRDEAKAPPERSSAEAPEVHSVNSVAKLFASSAAVFDLTISAFVSINNENYEHFGLLLSSMAFHQNVIIPKQSEALVSK